MTSKDEENIVFIIERDLYYYKMMPFGLTNIGAIYQYLVNKIFKQQIGCNMEIYFDDMYVKSIEADQHTDLEEAIEELRKYEIKLNLNKCAFGVTLKKFLDFLMTQRKIEANSEKIRALLEMKHLSTIKEVQ